jgi:hypothetical protein
MSDQVAGIVVHDLLCPMQACEHVRTWCEHECHCDSIADARAEERKRIAQEIEAERDRLELEGFYSTENFDYCASIARGTR